MAEALTLLALARPGTGFSLASGGRTLARGAAGRRPRRAPLPALRRDAARGPRARRGRHRLGGRARLRLAARPPAAARAPNLRLFVNGRAVRDRALSKAVLEAYRAAGAGEPRLRGVPVRRGAAAPGGRERAPGQDRGALRRRRARSFGGRRAGGARRRCPEGGARGAGAWAWRVGPRRRRGAREAAAAAFLERAGEPSATRPLWDGGERRRVARGGRLDRAGRSTRRRPCVLGPAPPRLHRGERRRRAGARGPAHGPRARALRAAARARAAGTWSSRRACSRRRSSSSPPSLRPVLEAHVEALRELGYDVEPFGGGPTRLRAVPAVLGHARPRARPRARSCAT